MAQHRAAQASSKEIKQTFEQIAHDWFVIAEQVEWLEKRGHFRPSKPEGERW